MVTVTVLPDGHNIIAGTSQDANGLLVPLGTCWLIFSYQPTTVSFELYLRNIKFNRSTGMCCSCCHNMGAFGKASELV